ncbi:aldose 1-epimerase [Deinococcus ruber]|uniref:Aldose 1-epimerase n=1 Tax=Deinococcus ruber TaxID=1848197 RepID=A0A918BYI1_9DEIO|nr:aldose 1-epimerase [Deinococcus ruber]GGQ96832.1 aldose 1-epimerase [Deinococcus ruber]
MQPVSIHNEHLSLEILPELGASVLNLSAASGRPVLRHVELNTVKTSSQCASFTLLPYSNRIRDARFSFEGREVQLRPTPGGSSIQHGDVRNRPWQVQRVSDTHLSCDFDSRTFSDVNWPWAFTARVEYLLHGPHLDISVMLTNTDTSPMPAGMGLHPYFARYDGDTDPALSFQAGGVYVADASSIPSAAAVPIPPELDFSLPRAVGAQALDQVYASWDGVARLSWNAGTAQPERALTITADSVYSHLVLFTAPDGSLALEPVTHATDAFNLAARGVHGTDMRVLASGQSVGGAVRLTLEGAW